MFGAWSQQAYIKASNTESSDDFGIAVTLSSDGNTLVVGARLEDSNATGINGIASNNSATDSGAVYAYTRDGSGTWTQLAYIKASNTEVDDGFGNTVMLSSDGNTLAVGAQLEDSNATGINGDDTNNLASGSGAVYVYTRNGASVWSQQAYVKASNTGQSDQFGFAVSLSGDGNTLAVGANSEASNATGINGDETDNSTPASGAAYVYTRDGAGVWSQQAYVKSSNTEFADEFGYSITLSSNGHTLAVGAREESSNAIGIDGDSSDNSAFNSGAVYVYTRDGASVWSQQAYVKASNTGAEDFFGHTVSLSGDGNTLAAGAYQESSNTTGIDGDQSENSAFGAGAVYVYTRDGTSVWSQQAYVKASNTGAGDLFGVAVILSNNGDTLAVGAHFEDSNATGIGGDESDNSASASGAVYLY